MVSENSLSNGVVIGLQTTIGISAEKRYDAVSLRDRRELEISRSSIGSWNCCNHEDCSRRGFDAGSYVDESELEQS